MEFVDFLREMLGITENFAINLYIKMKMRNIKKVKKPSQKTLFDRNNFRLYKLVCFYR